MSSSVAETVGKFDVFLQLYVGISVKRTTRYSQTARRRATRRSRAVAGCGDGNREPRGRLRERQRERHTAGLSLRRLHDPCHPPSWLPTA